MNNLTDARSIPTDIEKSSTVAAWSHRQESGLRYPKYLF
jgi:hypothetical protein